MNLSAAVMLFEENGVRPCRVLYDPEFSKNNNPNVKFKCVDPSVKKDDLVIVQTNTRHGFTIGKVEAIGYQDVPVDFNNSEQWGWIAAKFDSDGFKAILDSEKSLVGRVSEAHANQLRNELKQSMGLGQVSLADVFIKAPAAISSPHGVASIKEEAPSPIPPSAELYDDDSQF